MVCGGFTLITAMTLLFAWQVTWLQNCEDFVANYRHCRRRSVVIFVYCICSLCIDNTFFIYAKSNLFRIVSYIVFFSGLQTGNLIVTV